MSQTKICEKCQAASPVERGDCVACGAGFPVTAGDRLLGIILAPIFFGVLAAGLGVMLGNYIDNERWADFKSNHGAGDPTGAYAMATATIPKSHDMSDALGAIGFFAGAVFGLIAVTRPDPKR